MSIIKIFWRTIIMLTCSIIQLVGVIIEGIARMLLGLTKLLEKAHDWVLDRDFPRKKREKKVHINIPL